jgi:hypothetical protein
MNRAKTQIKPSVDLDVDRYLREEAKRLNKPYGVIVNEALIQYFDLDSLKNREAILLKRLDQIDRKVEGLHTNLSILSEAFSIYIKTYFARLAEIPKEQSMAAMSRANNLFNQFLQQVYEASLLGNSLFNDLPKEEFMSHDEATKIMERL